MDLNSLANGVDPKTGKYLSPEQRKEAFRKSLGKKPRSGYVSGRRGGAGGGPGGGSGGGDDGGVGGGLSKVYNFRVIEKLVEVKKIADELFKVKQERVRLESKFAETQRISREKNKRKKEESGMESRPSGGKNILSGFASKAAAKVGGGLFGILKALATFAILDFISKPENKNMVEGFVKLFMGIFKFFDFYVGSMVGNLLGGFTRLFGGGSILERVFGGLQLLLGVFLFKGFTRVLNPLKLIGDIKWALKNAKNFKELFKSLFSGNLKGMGDAIKQIFPKTASIFKKGLQGALQRVFLKVFGKNIFTFLKPFVGQVTKTLVKPLAKLVTRVPVVGTLLAIPINMFLGDPIDKAAVKAIGAGLGTFVVGALGSVVPGAGTVLGGIAGGLLGDFLAGWLYDSVIAPLGKTIFGGKKDQPQMNTGGIASGPESGYDVTLHGTEAVIPIDKLKDIALKPYKTVASIIIGSTMAVLKSMGAVGSALSPLALQMFNPFIRVFGISTETFASGIGRGADLFMSPASAKESEDPSDYLTEKDSSGTGKTSGPSKNKRGGTKSDEKPPGQTTSLVPEGGLKGLTDADWKELAYIVSGEAGPGDDRFGVAAAVLNRVSSSAWPNTIREVGRQKGQFEAVEKGTARYDQKLADDLKNNQGKIAAALKKLNGRDSFKGQSQLGNMGPGDVLLDSKGNFYHYRQQVGKNDPAPASPDQSWQKWIQAKEGGIIPLLSLGGSVDSSYRSREKKAVVVTHLTKAKNIKDDKVPQYSAGGSHRVIPDTPSTSWAAGIPLTYVKSSSGKRAEVAVPLAKRFQGFISDLESTGYKIKEMGGFRPDGPPPGNADGKGPMYAHPYGAAIDINWTKNPAFVGKRLGDFPPNTGQIAAKHGLGWGSKFDDAMHFSAMQREYGAGIDGKEISAKSLGGSKEGADYSPDTSGGDTSSSPSSAGGDKPKEPPKQELDVGMLTNLFSMLTGKAPGPASPPPPVPSSSPTPSAPSLPSPVPSKSSSLHSMSSQFTLDKKMSAAHGVQPISIINTGNNSINSYAQAAPLNTMRITETANLNLL